MLAKLSCIFILIFLSAFSTIVIAQSPIYIEFLYIDVSQSPYAACRSCPSWKNAYNEYVQASNLISQIEGEYGNNVHVERVDTTTAEGLARFNEYNLTAAQAVVLNGKVKLEGDQLTEENLKKYIDSYLRGEDPTSLTIQPASAVFAFSIGLFSGFSPCLMAMLAFILSYTSGTATSFRSGMLRVSVFGLGFITALLLLGALFAAVLTRIPSFTMTMMWAVSALMILVGLNLVGLMPAPSALKALGQKLGTRGRVGLAQRYRATTVGLFSLGFMFYFVNLCTAPLSFSVLPTLTTPRNIYLLPLFALGTLLPFLAIGILGGVAPRIAGETLRKHQLKIRAFSGIILIAYAVWLLVQQFA